MYAICDLASEKGVGILIDAEETWIQDPIDRLAIELMAEYNKEKVVVYNTYQLYRNDRYHFLQLSHKIAKEKNFKLGAKLVRGAYMEKEKPRSLISIGSPKGAKRVMLNKVPGVSPMANKRLR